MCDALTFATCYFGRAKVESEIRFGQGIYPFGRGKENPAARADAIVRLKKQSASISLTVPVTWRVEPPHLRCHEGWFRAGKADWHSYRDGGLCYIHPSEWRDTVEIVANLLGETTLVYESASYCAHLSFQLLERHSLGHRLKIKAWPVEWEAFSHHGLGTVEYQKQREQRLAFVMQSCQARLVAMKK